MAAQRDYYDILGVPRGASDADIKRSFRKLAQQWHPDVSTAAGADERFKEINEAYQVLSDPQRRQAYDTFGHAGVGAGAEGGFGGGGRAAEDGQEDDGQEREVGCGLHGEGRAWNGEEQFERVHGTEY